VSSDTLSGRVIQTGRLLHIQDLAALPENEFQGRQGNYLETGDRTVLCVPMMRDGLALGTIAVRRTEAEPFTDRQIALLGTFADQAVIAIENARLFSELEERNTELQESNCQVTEALEQQTATAEILNVIATSPTDSQPVLEVVVERARLLSGSQCVILAIRADDHIRVVAKSGDFPGAERRGWTRAVLEQRTIHIRDTSDPAERAAYPDSPLHQGITRLNVPLVHEGKSIGVLSINRDRVHEYSPREVALMETFARQAAIAIANTRLFQELQESNRQVTEALEQQTATAEVLRVIASSPTDLQRVLEILLENAARLCSSGQGVVYRFDGQAFRLAAAYGTAPAFRDYLARTPVPLSRGSLVGRAALERRAVQRADCESAVRARDKAARLADHSAHDVIARRQFELHTKCHGTGRAAL